jgi:hypothetical protein
LSGWPTPAIGLDAKFKQQCEFHHSAVGHTFAY